MGVQRADVVAVATADTTPVVTPAKGKKPVLPTVPKEAVATEKTLQTAQTKHAESKQVASAGIAQIEGTCRDPGLADGAPDPCPDV